MNEYDAGLLNDWGGGNVGWWHDYLRCELANANQHWIEQTEQLRAELAELRHFRKVIMDYDSNLYDALANSDAARKGEEE